MNVKVVDVDPSGPRQQQALRTIMEFMVRFDRPPTRDELGKKLKVSKVTAHLLVKKLERDQLVVLEQGTHRNIRLTYSGCKAVLGQWVE